MIRRPTRRQAVRRPRDRVARGLRLPPARGRRRVVVPAARQAALMVATVLAVVVLAAATLEVPDRLATAAGNGNRAAAAPAPVPCPHPAPGPPDRSAPGPPVGERSAGACGGSGVVHRGGRAVRAGKEGAGTVTEHPRSSEPAVVWRRSRAVGRPDRGRLVAGVQLPAAGAHFVTVDPVTRTSPNRAWRRYGTDRLLRVVLRVARAHAAAHPGAPRLVVGDLSRPRGGRFGPEYGGDGHRSHQNGLDADVYYPRRDGLERVPTRVAQVDRRLAQELVDRFVRAGAQFVFVGPATGLRGPPKVVMALANHDDHLHVRLRPAPRR